MGWAVVAGSVTCLVALLQELRSLHCGRIFDRRFAGCGCAGGAFAADAIHCRDGVEVAVARHDIHIAKRGSTQQLRILLLARRSFLFNSIDVVTGDIVFRADGPGKVEVGGRGGLRGDQDDDEALRRGGRESVERGDFERERVERFDLQIWVLRYAANGVAVRLAELNLGVAEGWRGAIADL